MMLRARRRWGRAVPLGLLLVLTATPVSALAIQTYTLHAEVAASGEAQVRGRVELAACAPGEVVLPLGFAAVRDFRLSAAPSGATYTVAPAAEQSLLRLALPPGVQESCTIDFELTATGLLVPASGPGGKGEAAAAERWTLRHTLLASREEPIGRYRAELVFPSGLRAHAVRDASPRLRKSEPGPRAALVEIDGRRGVRFEVGELRQGETAALQVELVPAARSPLWWVAGVALSVLYLYRFRDLVTSPQAGGEKTRAHS